MASITGYRPYDAFRTPQQLQDCLTNLKALGYKARPLTADPVRTWYEGDVLYRIYPELRYEVHVPDNSEL